MNLRVLHTKRLAEIYRTGMFWGLDAPPGDFRRLCTEWFFAGFQSVQEYPIFQPGLCVNRALSWKDSGCFCILFPGVEGLCTGLYA